MGPFDQRKAEEKAEQERLVRECIAGRVGREHQLRKDAQRDADKLDRRSR